MAYSLVPFIIITRVGDIKWSHKVRQIAQGGFNQKMKMVAHEDISMQFHVVNLEVLDKGQKESSPISVVSENVLSFVPTAGDMINSIGILDSEWPGHSLLLPYANRIVNIEDLTPIPPISEKMTVTNRKIINPTIKPNTMLFVDFGI